MPSISARELRAHFSHPSTESQTDYFKVATDITRAHSVTLTAIQGGKPTHWQTFDVATFLGRQQAACGEVVSLKDFSPTPTCPECRRHLAIYESLEF